MPMGSNGSCPLPRRRQRAEERKVYYWNNIQPGTYAYQSGTHPQVQVQMGLYGAMVKNSDDAGQRGLPRRDLR